MKITHLIFGAALLVAQTSWAQKDFLQCEYSTDQGTRLLKIQFWNWGFAKELRVDTVLKNNPRTYGPSMVTSVNDRGGVIELYYKTLVYHGARSASGDIVSQEMRSWLSVTHNRIEFKSAVFAGGTAVNSVTEKDSVSLDDCDFEVNDLRKLIDRAKL